MQKPIRWKKILRVGAPIVMAAVVLVVTMRVTGIFAANEPNPLLTGRWLVALNTDSSLVHLVDLDHPGGTYDTDIYTKAVSGGSVIDDAKVFSAGDAYPAGAWQTQIAGDYVMPATNYYQPPDGDALKAKFYWPQGVVVSATGDIYISDTWNHCVRKLTWDGVNAKWLVSLFAGTPQSAGMGADGVAAAASALNYLVGLALDAAEANLYIADQKNNRIRKVDLATNVIDTVAGNGGIPANATQSALCGDGAYLNAAALAAAAVFKSPSDVALDADGNIYVADYEQDRIRKISADLTEVQTIYGDGYQSATPGSVNRPRGVDVNRVTGEVYFSAWEGSTLYKATPVGGGTIFDYTTVIWGGTGAAGMNGNAGANPKYHTPVPDYPVASAEISHPRGVSIDTATGDLYWADEYNGSVRVRTADGVIKTITGNGNEAGSALPPDGVYAPGWQMYEPMGVFFVSIDAPVATTPPTDTPEPPSATGSLVVWKNVTGEPGGSITNFAFHAAFSGTYNFGGVTVAIYDAGGAMIARPVLKSSKTPILKPF